VPKEAEGVGQEAVAAQAVSAEANDDEFFSAATNVPECSCTFQKGR